MTLQCVCVLVLVAFSDARSQSYSGRVIGVVDGDTIDVLRDGRAIRVRLHGIDCPERGQAFGRQARQFTGTLVFGKTVEVRVRDTDRYGRAVAEVLLLDRKSLNRELVRAGLAWHYVRYSKDGTLARLQADARASRRGLWADSRPVPPWEFRKERFGRQPMQKVALNHVCTSGMGTRLARPLAGSLVAAGLSVQGCAALMWMYRGDGREFYKHIDTRRYLILDSDGGSYSYASEHLARVPFLPAYRWTCEGSQRGPMPIAKEAGHDSRHS